MVSAKTIGVLLAGLVLGTLALAPSARGDNQMERRRQEVKLELLRERARIIREDPDAVSVKERADGLERELAQLVDSKPEIKRLRAKTGQESKLELLRERARIIREDPAAVALKERIDGLALELARFVDNQPGIRRLQAELEAVEKVLERQADNR